MNKNIVAPVDNETGLSSPREKRSNINKERLIKVKLEEEKHLESSTKGQELKGFDKKVDGGNKNGKINGRKVVIGEDNDKKLNEEEKLKGLELQRDEMTEEKVEEKKQLNIKENNEKNEDEDWNNEEKFKMNEGDVNRMDEEGEENNQKNINKNTKRKEINKMNEEDEKEENIEEKVEMNKLNEEEEKENSVEENKIKEEKEKFKANEGTINANKLQNQQIVEENKIKEEKLEMDEEELFEINNENNEIKNKRWGRIEESYFSEESDDEVCKK
uniref:Uncharacterized protein n=1 Tax=Meloidogyne javanica TaxID=6303 RepID=A0A915LWZ9_MELJA